RLISFLPTGQPAAQPAALAGGKPPRNAPPTSAAQLGPVLRQAAAQSGLFYESHHTQWLAGTVRTEALQREPQGQHPPTPRRAAAGGSETAAAPRVAPSPMAHAGASPAAAEARAERAAEAAAQIRTPVVAERLMPVVHQQLDAMATQQYL